MDILITGAKGFVGRNLAENLKNIRDGDVILLHDMCDCSVTAALQIIDTLQDQGFRFVTVSELAQLRGVTPIPGQLYNRFE